MGCIEEPADPASPQESAAAPRRRELWLDPVPLEASISPWQLHTSGDAASFAALRLECRHGGASQGVG